MLVWMAGEDAFSQSADRQNMPLIRFGVGFYDIRRTSATGQKELEFAFPEILNSLQPFAGFIATGTHDGYVYVGMSAKKPLSNHLLLLPSFACGFYGHGNGIQLGYPLEFRSSLEIAWQWNSQIRLGVAFSHLSHGPLTGFNPGLETITLSIARTIVESETLQP